MHIDTLAQADKVVAIAHQAKGDDWSSKGLAKQADSILEQLGHHPDAGEKKLLCKSYINFHPN